MRLNLEVWMIDSESHCIQLRTIESSGWLLHRYYVQLPGLR
jgi:hypothetical protein